MLSKEEAKEKLKELINEFSQIHKSYLDTMPEEDIKHRFIEPLFENILGWDRKEVQKEQRVLKGRADYILKIGNQELLVIEAKKTNIHLSDEDGRQAVSYAYHRKIKFAVLTNFKHLRVYHALSNIKNIDKNLLKVNNDYFRLDFNEFVDKFVNIKGTESTDGSFIQIGIRPVLEEDIFISEGFDERLPGAGRIIAISERDFLIQELLKNEKIKSDKTTLKDFIHCIPYSDSIILFSINFFMRIFTMFQDKIDYEKKFPRLNKMQELMSVPGDFMDNKMIIIQKNSILWKKELFNNEYLDKKTFLDIRLGTLRPNGKIDITIRSVNKLVNVDVDKIKILEIID